MNLLFRKLLLLPFYLLVLAVDLAGSATGALFRSRKSKRPKSAFAPGISIVIPERSNQAMLRRCLESLQPACVAFDEPVEVIVIVSDSDPAAYADLRRAFPASWIFHRKPLWFLDAVRIGIAAGKYDWIYLLNTDMVLDRQALHEVSKWRSPKVFAIASQIYFLDPARRREETGWTAIRNAGGLVEIRDVTPDDDDLTRAHAYAGGGSSLFQRELLARFAADTGAYRPFYWEDVEWGIAAWRAGYQSLFCPQSKVWHAHRDTNLKFFSHQEIQRVFRRNALRFQLRTAFVPGFLRTVFGTIARLDGVSYGEMLNSACVLRTLRARFRSYLDPLFKHRLITPFDMYYGRPRTPEKPLVLIVSPYAVYPPAHGGARRIHELIDRLADGFDIILLSDEAENYSAASLKYFRKCHAVCLVGGRKANPDRDGRIDRILTHSHSTLATQLQALTVIHDPDVVQIEYIELAKLVERRDSRPWILTLHDVLLAEHAARPTEDDRFELQYINRYDALIACSPEDRALLAISNVHIVPNGANMTARYRPSVPHGPILFLGPFRYAPNLAGIIEFLEKVYPAIRHRVAGARLWILGGAEARIIAQRHRCFQQPGVRVFDFIEDVGPYLESCAITINPDKEVRGSSLKVIESLAAGRVCVSTNDGGRGLKEFMLPSLVIVEDEGFADEISRLLTDIEYRHRIEIPIKAINRYSWEKSAEEQARIYYSLLQDGSSTQMHALAQADTKVG
jgi:GT2 family glycosyltransferase/glycosyltransferase involved in cell wall biosynthesis